MFPCAATLRLPPRLLKGGCHLLDVHQYRQGVAGFSWEGMSCFAASSLMKPVGNAMFNWDTPKFVTLVLIKPSALSCLNLANSLSGERGLGSIFYKSSQQHDWLTALTTSGKRSLSPVNSASAITGPSGSLLSYSIKCRSHLLISSSS